MKNSKKVTGALSEKEINFLVRWSKTYDLAYMAKKLNRNISSIKSTYEKINTYKASTGLKKVSTKNVLAGMKFKAAVKKTAPKKPMITKKTSSKKKAC